MLLAPVKANLPDGSLMSPPAMHSFMGSDR